jgi:hypothetical protein
MARIRPAAQYWTKEEKFQFYRKMEHFFRKESLIQPRRSGTDQMRNMPPGARARHLIAACPPNAGKRNGVYDA